MNDHLARIAVLTVAITVAACGLETSTEPPSPPAPPKPEPTSMEGATCAVIPADVEFGSWKHRSNTNDCLRALAYEDWPKAAGEAAHIATWDIGGANLDELIGTLTRYDSADAVKASLDAYELLNGKGDPESIEYYGEDWQPLTGSDWLLKGGSQHWFDAETGMHPNQHDALLYELAALFGEPFADATFSETAPHWESDEPYQLHAALGDRKWNRQAENYGDWYDVSAVLDLINEMAADIGIPERAMPLETYDQTVTIIVGPGGSLIAAASDGLVLLASASSSMDRGKAFEDEFRKLYRIDAE